MYVCNSEYSMTHIQGTSIAGLISLLLTCGSPDSNLNHQAWHQVPLPNKSSSYSDEHVVEILEGYKVSDSMIRKCQTLKGEEIDRHE